MTTEQITEKLFKLKKVKKIFHLFNNSCLRIKSKRTSYDVVLPTKHLEILLNSFSFDNKRGVTYLKMYLPEHRTKYLHQMLCPAIPGHVVHHVYLDGLLNMSDGLQSIALKEHSRFHRELKCKK
jgi:hypothetical protein